MDSYRLSVVKSFLEEHWNQFEVSCNEADESAEEILQELEEEING